MLNWFLLSILDPSNLPLSENDLHTSGDDDLDILLQHNGTEKDQEVQSDSDTVKSLIDMEECKQDWSVLLLKTIEH